MNGMKENKMFSSKQTACSAHDVLLEVVRTNSDIQSLQGVIYSENENWLDRKSREPSTVASLLEAMIQDRVHRGNILR